MKLMLAIVALMAVSASSVAEEQETWELDNPRIRGRRVGGVQKCFPVRTVERRDGGLFLNGRRVEVKAADWPADAASCGVELTDRVIKRAVIALKAKGYNVLRPAGAPSAAVSWCEKVGLLVEDWPTADRIPAAEIVKPVPPAKDCRPESVARDRVANIHLSHVHRGRGRRELSFARVRLRAHREDGHGDERDGTASSFTRFRSRAARRRRPTIGSLSSGATDFRRTTRPSCSRSSGT